MKLDANKLSALIEKAREKSPVYYEMDSLMKCEFSFHERELRFIVCFYRVGHKLNQLIHIARKRHVVPDQYADIKIGSDKQMNLYAGKSITYTSALQVKNELENIVEFLTEQ
jgi:hypothetical protein